MDDLSPDYDALPIGEARARIEPMSSHKRGRWAISLAFLGNGAAIASWVSRIPEIRHEHGLTEGQLGLALLGMAVGSLLGFPVAAAMCARIGNRSSTVLLGVLLCLILGAIPFAGSLSGLVAILACFGFAYGGMDVAMNANGVDVEHRYGRSIMSSLHGMYSLGGLLGSSAGWLIAKLGIAPTTHLIGASLFLATMMALLYPAMWHEKPTGHANHPTFAMPSKSLWAIGAIVTCAFLCEGAMGDWSGVYLRDGLKTSAEFAVSGFMVYSLMMTVARFSGDALMTRWGASRVLRTAGTISGVGFAIALFSGHPILALIGFGCVGLGMSTVAPIGFGAAGRSRQMAPGTAIAAVATMGYSGFLVGPPLIGFLAEWITLRWALGVVAILSLVIAGLAKNAEG